MVRFLNVEVRSLRVHPVAILDTVALGLTVFASTNVDDVLLLSAFFAQPRRRTASIVTGQFLGIGALTAVSGGAALAALVIPREWTALIGVVPLVLGIRQLIGYPNEEGARAASGSDVLTVAAVTVANGGDNLGVYIPLFASQPAAIPLFVTVFAVGTAALCALGYALVSHPTVAATFQRYAHRALPWVLIALGLYVLSGAAPLVAGLEGSSLLLPIG